MSDLVPAANPPLLASLAGRSGAGPAERLRSLMGQAAVRRALPWFGAVAGLGALALTWAVLAPAPQRILHGQLDDSQRASVVAALDKADIAWSVDNDTGALSVNEEDLYRARMVVASEGSLAIADSGMDLLDSLPLGASRTMEGERLRTARERELMQTIKEIDGVEAVRVHLAEPVQSVFVREATAPSASVMLRLAGGRQLSAGQVLAIANLVASSVTGLSVDGVRIVDQHGRLLSQEAGQSATALELQLRTEEKLRAQISQLLTPVLGADNFSSEIQVELDMEERTAARESYDKEGAIRQEAQEYSRQATGEPAAGIPGATSNTPPPPALAQVGAQAAAEPAAPSAAAAEAGETRTTRSYELGREVAVSSSAGGRLKRLSVAVAISDGALGKGRAADIEKIRSLVAAAVGADSARGDRVEVLMRRFARPGLEQLPFYETGWFAGLVRNAVALVGVLLVLLLGVRPVLRALRRPAPQASLHAAAQDRAPQGAPGPAAPDAGGQAALSAIDRSLLNRQLGEAQKLAQERPERAVIAIRQMLGQSGTDTAA